MKKLSFWIITTVGLPILCFALLEVSLHLIGYGHPTDYFITKTIDGKEYAQPNSDFGLQFFHPDVPLSPLETTISKEKGEDTIRIFVLGGSAARGFPDPDFGFSRLLETILQLQYPDQNFEVVNTAMTAINSHVVREIARSVSEQQGDISIILMGNNEVVGPYGPGTVFQAFTDSMFMIRTALAVKRSRIGQLIGDIITPLLNTRGTTATEWKGMQMFVENRVRWDDPRLPSVYRHFRKNMADVIGYLRDAGQEVLVATVPVNLRDTAPFASLHDPELRNTALDRWNRLYHEGINSSDINRCGEAIPLFLAADEIDDSFADLHFRVAQCYSELGDASAANEHYRRACDLDALRFRADREINRSIRAVVSVYSGKKVRLANFEKRFEEASSPALPGQNLFFEHVHFNFAGNYLLAADFAGIIGGMLPNKPVRPVPTIDELADLVVYPNQKTQWVLHKLIDMFGSPPFSYELNRDDQVENIRSALHAATLPAASLDTLIGRYEAALNMSVRDWRMRFDYAQLLLKKKKDREAEQQLTLVLRYNPHHFNARMVLVRLLQQRGIKEEALQHLKEAWHYTYGNRSREAAIQRVMPKGNERTTDLL